MLAGEDRPLQVGRQEGQAADLAVVSSRRRRGRRKVLGPRERRGVQSDEIGVSPLEGVHQAGADLAAAIFGRSAGNRGSSPAKLEPLRQDNPNPCRASPLSDRLLVIAKSLANGRQHQLGVLAGKQLVAVQDQMGLVGAKLDPAHQDLQIPGVDFGVVRNPLQQINREAFHRRGGNAPHRVIVVLTTLGARLQVHGDVVAIELASLSIGEAGAHRLTDAVEDPTGQRPRHRPRRSIPALATTAINQVGDIWILGDHRVGCGDSRDLAFLQSVVGDGSQADAAFLDPPYNVKIQGHANVTSRHREFAMASGEMTQAGFRGFLTETLGACAAVSRDGAVHYVCMDWRHMGDVEAVGGEIYGDLLNLCIWNKSNAGMGSLYRSKHELVFVYRVGTAQHLNTVELGKHGRNRTNVWDYASVNTFGGSRWQDLALHPTVKPVAMVADAFQDVTRRGDLVLDAFLGSGASLIAAERTGRRFRGLDIDPLYVDLAVERWRLMTGGTPQLKRLAKAA